MTIVFVLLTAVQIDLIEREKSMRENFKEILKKI